MANVMQANGPTEEELQEIKEAEDARVAKCPYLINGNPDACDRCNMTEACAAAAAERRSWDE